MAKIASRHRYITNHTKLHKTKQQQNRRWRKASTASRIWEGNHPHRRAHHIDIDGLSSWVVSDDDFVATEAVGKAVNKRLHEPRVSSIVDEPMCLMDGDDSR